MDSWGDSYRIISAASNILSYCTLEWAFYIHFPTEHPPQQPEKWTDIGAGGYKNCNLGWQLLSTLMTNPILMLRIDLEDFLFVNMPESLRRIGLSSQSGRSPQSMHSCRINAGVRSCRSHRHCICEILYQGCLALIGDILRGGDGGAEKWSLRLLSNHDIDTWDKAQSSVVERYTAGRYREIGCDMNQNGWANADYSQCRADIWLTLY